MAQYPEKQVATNATNAIMAKSASLRENMDIMHLSFSANR
jgi:hypothetical protein